MLVCGMEEGDRLCDLRHILSPLSSLQTITTFIHETKKCLKTPNLGDSNIHLVSIEG